MALSEKQHEFEVQSAIKLAYISWIIGAASNTFLRQPGSWRTYWSFKDIFGEYDRPGRDIMIWFTRAYYPELVENTGTLGIEEAYALMDVGCRRNCDSSPEDCSNWCNSAWERYRRHLLVSEEPDVAPLQDKWNFMLAMLRYSPHEISVFSPDTYIFTAYSSLPSLESMDPHA